MPKFVIAYHGGKQPETPEAGKAHMQKYGAWLESLGGAALEPTVPLGSTHLVDRSGVRKAGHDERMSGYTVVEAEHLDAALAIARRCPFLEIDGTLEVAQVMSMGCN